MSKEHVLKYDKIKRVEEKEDLPLEDKIEVANEVIEYCLSKAKKPSVAFSGGKNSLVLLHLVLQHNPEVYVTYNNTLVEYPDNIKFVRWIAKEWDLNFYETRPATNYWRILKVYGIQDKGRRWGRYYKEPECCKLLKTGPVADLYNELGVDCYFTGISAFESRARKLTISAFGLIREGVRKVGQRGHLNNPTIAAYPVAYFTEEDCWEYIKKYELPVNPVYERWGIKRNGCRFCLNYLGSEEYVMKTFPKVYRRILKLAGQSSLDDF